MERTASYLPRAESIPSFGGFKNQRCRNYHIKRLFYKPELKRVKTLLVISVNQYFESNSAIVAIAQIESPNSSFILGIRGIQGVECSP